MRNQTRIKRGPFRGKGGDNGRLPLGEKSPRDRRGRQSRVRTEYSLLLEDRRSGLDQGNIDAIDRSIQVMLGREAIGKARRRSVIVVADLNGQMPIAVEAKSECPARRSPKQDHQQAEQPSQLSNC